MPGVDSVKHAYLGQGMGAAHSPKASRIVEAMFLELCRIHYEDHTLAGTRVNRWGAVRRDYSLIRDNVHNSRDLLAAAPIQLYEVNQRTLLQWHNDRSKAMMTDMVRVAVPGPSAEQTAAEPLPPARALLTEPLQPDQPLAFHLPEDASGQAVTHRGPLAPDLYGVLTASATAASSSSSSSTVCTPSASVSDAGPAPSAATAPSVPRSTLWQRKIREELNRRAQEQDALFKPRKNFESFKCSHCGQPKTKENMATAATDESTSAPRPRAARSFC